MSRSYLVPILLPADPIAAMEAATKQYVDGKVGGVGYLPLSGGTLTGLLKIEQSGTFDLTTYPGGSLQIGGNSASVAPVNMIFNGEKIQARYGPGNPGQSWPLLLQPLGQAVRIGDHTITDSSLQLLGALPTAAPLYFYAGGQMVMKMFPFGAALPVDFVIQTQGAASVSKDISIQAGNGNVMLQAQGSGINNFEVGSGRCFIRGSSADTFKIIAGASQGQVCYTQVFQNDETTRLGYYGAQGGYFRWTADSTLPAIFQSLNAQAEVRAGTYLAFFTSGAEEARIDATGHVMFGMTSASINNNGFWYNASTNAINDTTPAANVGLILNKSTLASGHDYIHFRNTNTTIGSITRNGTTAAVLYNTSSDYRLKDERGPIVDALDRLDALVPRRFVWKEDEIQQEQDGFFAHEVAGVVPEAVTGEKDAVATETNEDKGLVEGEIIPQQLDTSRLVPLLVAAVQELTAEVESLRAEIDLLKGAA